MPMTLLRLLTIVVLVSAAVLPAQRRVDPRNSFYRIIAVVPLVAGANGTAAWPKYVPTAPPSGSSAPSIIAFASEISDDGKHAVVELVGANPAECTKGSSPDLRVERVRHYTAFPPLVLRCSSAGSACRI
jgi:hypothetical protein